MELPDRGVELGREGGHPRALERACGHDDLARLVATVTGGRDERLAFVSWRLQSIDPDAGVDREAEVAGVQLEVVAHLVAGRERALRERKWHAGQRVVARRRVQLQRVVAASPDVPDAVVGLDDPRGDARAAAGGSRRQGRPDRRR